MKEFPREVLEQMHGSCGHCGVTVDNREPNHLVTPIMDGGRGVECVLRGDIHPMHAGPLRGQR